ncbi:small heat shock protein, chloroplastic-like [Chenopodium quinoa]|uniref:small heat shock protein, chloroplastic-like n=1 Tax=Chenopodium quinoa TaxID=63459 RepID=UPI000B787995|nr:small heat shock protein, chloroplastic-like [Chenopodium quinoa]
MAQSLSQFSNTIPFTKSSNTFCGHSYFYPKKFQQKKPSFNGGIKAMKADRRENPEYLQKSGLRRREPSAAPIGLWDRFPSARTVQQMLDTMDRVMEEPVAYNSSWQSPLPNNGGEYVRGRTPWEIKETEGAYKLRFDMPGMTKEDVKLWVEEKMLVIKAEKVSKSKDGQENGAVENEGDWPAKSFGKYSSRIVLPENIDFEKIKAEVRDGVLYITIPKASISSKVLSINVE